jgi:hypothetical protein
MAEAAAASEVQVEDDNEKSGPSWHKQLMHHVQEGEQECTLFSIVYSVFDSDSFPRGVNSLRQARGFVSSFGCVGVVLKFWFTVPCRAIDVHASEIIQKHCISNFILTFHCRNTSYNRSRGNFCSSETPFAGTF